MAESEPETKSSPRDIWIKPVGVFFRCVVMFLDVGTLMVRFLFNTLVYQSPLGRTESVDTGSPPSRD